ncbi:MAG: hypothetical protein NVS3B10_26330 [Polyangiales bacterium]
MRRSLLLVVVSLVACGTRSGASADSVLDDAAVDGADAGCRPLAEFCGGDAAGCDAIQYGSPDCAKFLHVYAAQCGTQPAYRLGFGIDTTLFYTYDRVTKALAGVQSTMNERTTCWGVVAGTCGDTGLADLCGGGSDAATGG